MIWSPAKPLSKGFFYISLERPEMIDQIGRLTVTDSMVAPNTENSQISCPGRFWMISLNMLRGTDDCVDTIEDDN